MNSIPLPPPLLFLLCSSSSASSACVPPVLHLLSLLSYYCGFLEIWLFPISGGFDFAPALLLASAFLLLPLLHRFRFLILPANLSEIIPNASWEAIDLISRLCSWDPRNRPTAEQALQHPFFNVATRVTRPIQEPFKNKQHNSKTKPNLELNLWDSDSKSDDCYLGLSLAVNPSVSNMQEMGNTLTGNAGQVSATLLTLKFQEILSYV